MKEMNVSPTGGLRDNKGKPRLSLVPYALIRGVAEVIFKSSNEGGGKYPMNNWRKGLGWTGVAESALRHLFKWLSGEDFDEETGLHHLKHVATNVAFLLEYLETHPELDDRYKAPLQVNVYKAPLQNVGGALTGHRILTTMDGLNVVEMCNEMSCSVCKASK